MRTASTPLLTPRPLSPDPLGATMSSLSLPASGLAGHRAMALIEARRMARHPVFLLGAVLGFGVLGLDVVLVDDQTGIVVVLTLPLLGAFYIGLASVIAAALLTRS